MKEIILKPLYEIQDTLWENLKSMEGGTDLQLQTLPTLNKYILGIYRKRMYVIGGRTSQGKTTLALQIAMDLARQGKRVYFLSLEMDETELMLRMLANIFRADANDIRLNVSSYENKLKMSKAFFKGGKFPLLLTYNVGLTMGQLENLIHDLPNPDVVIVDYLQAIRKLDFDKLSTMNNYLLGFRQLAVEKNFTGILVSQINRAAMDDKDKKPNLWQLKGTGTIEEHADLVMLCHWDYFYTSKDINDYQVFIAKNRQGNTGFVKLSYIPSMYLFEDVGESLKTPEIEQAKEVFKGAYVE